MTLDQPHAELREPPQREHADGRRPERAQSAGTQRDQRDLATGGCQHLRNARPLAMTLDVEHDDRPVRECGAGQHLGRRRGAEECGRRRPGRDHDKSRRAAGAFGGVGLDAELDLCPESLELLPAPVDQLRERALQREARDQAHLASGRRVALEHGHAMAALRRDASGFEAGEARPDHEHAPRLARNLQIAECMFVARGGVLDARDGKLAEATRDAQVVSDARSDALCLAAPRAGRHERVGDQGARHPDQVAGAFGERCLGDLGHVDPPFGDDGQPGRRALGTSRERHPVAGLELHRRHDQEGLLVVAVPDADVVDLTARREVGDRFLVPLHGRGHGDPEQALRADLGPQRLQDLAREAGAPFERPSVAVSPAIPLRGEELIDERVVGEHAFDAVHTGGERSPRAATWPSTSTAMSSSSIALRPSGPPGARPAPGAPALGVSRERIGVRAEVVELRDEHRAMLVHCVDDAAQRGYEALVA